jgi:hypothetical protein
MAGGLFCVEAADPSSLTFEATAKYSNISVGTRAIVR